MSSGRPVALIVHDDGEVLDLLTWSCEAAQLRVIAAVSVLRARACLQSEHAIDVVIAPWERAHPLGGEVYRWVLDHRPDLRNRFVFLADDVPAEFDALVAGRCLVVPSARIDELVAVVLAAARRAHTPPLGLPAVTLGPTLLLVDDDPLLLDAMGALLAAEGYNVSTADGARSALQTLARSDFDLIVCDWRLHDGSGAQIYGWIAKSKPALVERVVFLSEADDDDSGPNIIRPMFRKGQDSRALIEQLRSIAKR
jgi:DNA-binding response OmpR family regulator